MPAVVVGAAGSSWRRLHRAFSDDHALFPGGAVGWALAVLTGIIVGHLVALGRDRWWGGTGSGAALTLAVLLLYGWVPAGTGQPRRRRPGRRRPPHRWRQGVLHGAVDILGIGAGALVLAAFGAPPDASRHPWDADDLGRLRRPRGRRSSPPPISPSPAPCCGTCTRRAAAACPPSPARRWSGRGWSRVALLGIAPLICVVATAQPVLLPLFAVPLIALDSTLWIARARAEEQLRDPLTGLPNRQWLLERTWTALDDAERIGARSALVLIDLDRFRSVNDTLGHLAGDRLLLQIADRLRLALPRGAEAARLGGDEFAVLLPVADSTTSAQRVARNLVAALGSPLDLDGLTLVLEASAGRRRLPRPRAGRRGAAAPRRRGDVPGQAGPHAASRCTSPSGTATPPTGSACSATCAAPWTPATSNCTTSPRSASTARSPGWRRWCAGCIRSAAGCRRTSSSPSPSPPG